MNSEGVVKLSRSWIVCPGCHQPVEAVARDGWVRGYCTVAGCYVNFLAETQPICIGKNPAAETAEISASVKKQLQDTDPSEVVRAYLRGAKTIDIQLKYKISPGKMYRILHSAGVRLRRH